MKQNCIYLAAIAIIASLLSACHNGGEKPADQEKVLDHLVFEELCYSGTMHEKGYPYKDDHYLKIANPTNKTIYLDGMGIAISAISAKQEQLYLQEGTDFRATHFCASTLLRFPGEVGGTKYPINAKSSVLLTAVARNHTINPTPEEESTYWNKNSMDLSKADFEWATPEHIEYEYDEEVHENPNVPNLIQVYPDVQRSNISILLDGYALALIQFPKEVTNDMLLSQSEKNPYFWGYSYTTDDQGGGHSHGGKRLYGLKIPYSMVVDAVQLSSKLNLIWIKEADKGYTSIYGTNKDDLFPRSVFRKFDGLKFVDDDDSSTDFEVREASLAQKSQKA